MQAPNNCQGLRQLASNEQGPESKPAETGHSALVLRRRGALACVACHGRVSSAGDTELARFERAQACSTLLGLVTVTAL